MPPTAEVKSAAELIAAARAQTGLQEFGEPSILPALEILVGALNREARLSPGGIEGRNGSLMRLLTNRLLIQDRLARHPEIEREEIRGPIVIVGLPRSGTTKLQRMMAADSSLQALPLWKILNPVDDGSADSARRRIAMAEAYVERMRTQFPSFHAAHPMNAREPDEEVFLMELTFRVYMNAHGAQVPTFKAWLDQQSFEGWYRYLRSLLRLYQFQDKAQGKPWLLKAPFHLGHLPELFAHFPNAIIVHCHRDPRTSIASMFGLFEESRRMSSDDVDPLEVGQTFPIWTNLMASYMRDRPRLETAHRFVDVPYREIVRDAPGVIARIYRSAGLELAPQAVAAMAQWDADNAQHKHGRHSYTLERYGITTAEIDDAFGPYCRRFAAEIAV